MFVKLAIKESKLSNKYGDSTRLPRPQGSINLSTMFHIVQHYFCCDYNLNCLVEIDGQITLMINE